MTLVWILAAAILFTAHIPSSSALLKAANESFSLNTHDIKVVVNQLESIVLLQSAPVTLPSSVRFVVADQDAHLLQLIPSSVQLHENTSEYIVNVLGKSAGRTVITSESRPSNISSLTNVFLRVSVLNNAHLDNASFLIGWLYFVAWSVSFYPQIYTNHRRKSVTGLNFDFLLLNAIGFALYTVYNVALYGSERIADEYHERFPHGQLPVLGNDVVFSVHALLATLLTIGQCTRYERGLQRVSWAAWTFAAVVGLTVALLVAVGAGGWLRWLDVFGGMSYIKLLITLIKYVPQAVMNYRRKSTLGWSIGNVCLDLTGGLLSMLQMLLNAYNFNDWASIFGDPTKFGLGLFSVLFDVFFMVQHYVWYRHTSPYDELSGDGDVGVSRVEA